jgi:methyltransferase (TIGR00027 family)
MQMLRTREALEPERRLPMSSKKTIENSPSKTAMFAALYRAIAHKEAAKAGSIRGDDLAEHFLPRVLRALLKLGFFRRSLRNKSEELTPGLYDYVIARTAFMDEQYLEALKDGVEQIVLLGAGYDTRASRLMNGSPNVLVFELDADETQKRKKACLAKTRTGIPEGVVFASIDFDKEALKDVLERSGYDNTRKTLFVWEGVSYYISQAAVKHVLDQVKHNRHPQSRIAFDYAVALNDTNVDRIFGARAFLKTWRKRRAGEPFVFTLEEGALPTFLEAGGLELKRHSDADEIDRRYHRQVEGRDHSGRVAGYFGFAVAARRQHDGH